MCLTDSIRTRSRLNGTLRNQNQISYVDSIFDNYSEMHNQRKRQKMKKELIQVNAKKKNNKKNLKDSELTGIILLKKLYFLKEFLILICIMLVFI